jgi:hypothetical protein
MVSPEQEDRPKIEEIVKHPFVATNPKAYEKYVKADRQKKLAYAKLIEQIKEKKTALELKVEDRLEQEKLTVKAKSNFSKVKD